MAKSSVFKLFGTSKNAEKEGIWLNFEDVKFRVARAGGSHTEFAKALEAKIKPVRHQLSRSTLSKEEDNRINAELYAEVIIKDILVKVEEIPGQPDKWVKGVPSETGEVLPFTVPNVVKLLLELPDLFREIRDAASDINKFLVEQENEDLKNS